MKSIKPGRGPSMLSGVMCVAVGVFGVIWTAIAAGIGGGLFALFGVVFVVIAVVTAVYNFKNASSPNRFSTFDITDDSEEPDPLNERFKTDEKKPGSEGSAYCPFCGAKLGEGFEYCG